jgi:hypothetical protein
MPDLVKMPHGLSMGHAVFITTTPGNVNPPEALAEPVAPSV